MDDDLRADLVKCIELLFDVMERSDAEVSQDNPTSDEEWDAALVEAQRVLQRVKRSC